MAMEFVFLKVKLSDQKPTYQKSEKITFYRLLNKYIS